MPYRFPFSFSLSGVNPEVYLVIQLIQLYINLFNIQNISESHLRLSFLAILGDAQVVPFFNYMTKQRMLMHGRVLNLLLGGLSNHPFYSYGRRFSLRITNMILRRIIYQMLEHIGEVEIKRSIRIFESYRAHLQVHPAKIFLGSSSLEIIKNLEYFEKGDKWMFLVSKFSEPIALKHLTPSDNPNVQLAIVCREFLRLYKSGNELFCKMLCCIPYKHAKKDFFMSSRTKYFKEFNKSFRLLKKVFKKKLHPEMSHFDACDKIFDIFFKMMNESTPATWNFLGKVFAEESSESLHALCEKGNIKQEYFSFTFDYPTFRQLPCDASIRMFQCLRRVHSLQIRPELIRFCKLYSGNHHDEKSKSLWACGIYWILILSSIIQNGDSFLNFVLHSVIEEMKGEDSHIFSLNLVLTSSVNSDPSYTILQQFWVEFSKLRGKYIKERTVSFSEMLFSFLDILEEPQFFRSLQNFCFNDFVSQKDFEEKFLQFWLWQRMINSHPKDIFSKFFYPRVYDRCKRCSGKIYYSNYLKCLKLCQDCCESYHSVDETIFDIDD